jgi:small-conductance mechanosensitive channel
MSASVPPSDSAAIVDDVSAGEAVNLLLTRPAIAIGVVIFTWVFVRIMRSVVHRSVRRIADRSVLNPTSSFWRTRVQRVFGETPELAEKRRRQRIDAMSRMVSHLIALVSWVTAVVVVLHVMQVDLVPVLTSAGFIGAGLAIGGQHAVRDFISGIGIMVEDRLGVGDRVVIETPTGALIDGVVEHVGAFSTRLSSDGSTFHVSNGELTRVRNLSQRPVTTSLEVPIPARIDESANGEQAAADAVAFAFAQAAGDRRLTGLVLVDDVKAAVRTEPGSEPRLQVEVRTAQPLTGAQADTLQRVAADALWRVPMLADSETDVPTESEGGEAD